MSDDLSKTFKEVYWGGAIILLLIIIIPIIVDLYQMNKNEKDIGLSLTNEERECYEACGEDNYFYSYRTTFTPAVCECGKGGNGTCQSGETCVIYNLSLGEIYEEVKNGN